MKFETVLDEYNDKKAQFDVFREASKKKGEDTVRQELDAVKNKNEVLKRN
jgi:hypothetical protein